MSGSGGTFHHATQLLFHDVGRIQSSSPTGIHCAVGRAKNDVDAGVLAELSVASKIARVATEVFGGSELGWIDVDTDDDETGLPCGLASACDEADMPGVEVTHGGNE